MAFNPDYHPRCPKCGTFTAEGDFMETETGEQICITCWAKENGVIWDPKKEKWIPKN
jgi:hypothetical protein